MSNDQNFQDDPQPGPAGRNGPSWFLIGLVVVAIVCAIFVFQNGTSTTVEFLFFTYNTRVWTAIAVSIGLGIVLDRLILGWWRRARRRRNE